MLRASAKGMWAHKRRLFGTVFAVVLGVAFLAGTLVLGDTMRAGIDDAFTEANAGIDAAVRGEAKVGSDETESRALLDQSLFFLVGGVLLIAIASGMRRLLAKFSKPTEAAP